MVRGSRSGQFQPEQLPAGMSSGSTHCRRPVRTTPASHSPSAPDHMRQDHHNNQSRRPAGPATVTAPEPGERDGNGALNWIVRYAVPLAGVIGAALYGVLRLAYVFFYLWLRATPDEVGYGYSQVLADELIGAIELVILTASVIAITVFAISILVSLAKHATVKYRSKPILTRLIDKTKVQRIAI